MPTQNLGKKQSFPRNKIFASFTILVLIKLRSVKVWSIKAKQGPRSELPDVARQAGLRPVGAGDDQDSKIRISILSIPVGNYTQLALNLGNKAN